MVEIVDVVVINDVLEVKRGVVELAVVLLVVLTLVFVATLDVVVVEVLGVVLVVVVGVGVVVVEVVVVVVVVVVLGISPGGQQAPAAHCQSSCPQTTFLHFLKNGSHTSSSLHRSSSPTSSPLPETSKRTAKESGLK